MRTHLRLIAIATFLSLAVPPSIASASSPMTVESSFIAVERLPDEACGFPLRFRVEGTTAFRLWFDADGAPIRARSTGRTWVTFTHGGTGATARFSIPGPSFFDADINLVRGTGRWFAMSAEGRPLILSGDWRFPNGEPVGTGAVVDVCDRLS
jgi:hypothetical protein